jgi:hypothetical protein
LRQIAALRASRRCTMRAFLRREQSKLATLAATLVAPLVLLFAFLLLLNDATSAGPSGASCSGCSRPWSGWRSSSCSAI